MDSIKTTPRQIELMLKFQTAVQQNREWFTQYIKDVKPGQMMPYHPNLGMTKTEYEELISNTKNIESISSGKENILIVNDGKIITFRSQGKLAGYNSVEINLDSNMVKIGSYHLKFSESVNVTNENNALKSKWKGYNWRFEYPGNTTVDLMKNYEKMQLKNYIFTLGVLEKTGKIFIQMKGDEINYGVKEVSFDIPITF
jgi:hypothetical protein